MGIREKYEIPDWVVDDYNSRVSEEDRLLLGSNALQEDAEHKEGYSYTTLPYKHPTKPIPERDPLESMFRFLA